MAESTEANKHFVYIYRNRRGNPLYVGKGCSAERPLSHVGTQAHNEELRQALADEQDYTVEIAGPFGNKELSELIEAALIPALAATPGAGSHLRNKINGRGVGVFRPLGVPAGLEEMALQPPLISKDIKTLTKGGRALVVYVGSKKLGEREGVDLALLPSDSAIQDRMVHWWQLDRFMSSWKARPELVPAVLTRIMQPMLADVA